jgi:hypothetical protein
MKKTLRMALRAALGAAMVFVGALTLQAQDQQPGQGGPGAQGGPGGPGGPGGFRRMDPAQMEEFMLTRIKDRLSATDEEWSAMKPLVQEVMKLRRGQGGMGMMGFGGRRRGGDQAQGGDQNRPRGPRGMMGEQSPEAQALNQAVESGASNDEIKAKLTAYREAQKKRDEEIKAAREKLRAVVNVKQEATLVLMGMLD